MNINITTILSLAVIAIAIVSLVINFINLPKADKVKNVKEWLKWAVVEAEKALGSGTGQIKLRMVYDMAIKQFPWLVQLISFDTFSGWVDEALIWMEEQLDKNKAIKDYTVG